MNLKDWAGFEHGHQRVLLLCVSSPNHTECACDVDMLQLFWIRQIQLWAVIALGSDRFGQ